VTVLAYDHIVVGAGSAGCVLAARLSDDANRRVLLLEAGPTDRHPYVRIPAAFSRLFKSALDWDYQTEPEPFAGARSLYIPRGKTLGGSSSINAMIYTRGRPHDYDTWEAMGAVGWGWEQVLPLFIRSENNERGPSPYHGTGGPLNVADVRSAHLLTRMFIEAAIATGITANDDFNGETQDGVGLFQVTTRNSRRWSSADAFLRPALKRPNLSVFVEAPATSIVTEGGRVVGVRFRRRGRSEQAAAPQVTLCAGTINTPQLLQVSGIGPGDLLHRLGIPIVVDNPHVGEHLQDHPAVAMVYESKLTGTYDEARRLRHLVPYLLARRGMLTSNIAEAGAFVRTDPALPAADLQFHFGPAYFAKHALEPYNGNAFSFGPSLLTPHSRGKVTIRSADPTVYPAIRGNHLRHPGDVETLVKGLELGREIVHTPPLASVWGAELYPGAGVTDRDQLAEHVRNHAELIYHPVGTARIGGPADGVVDPELRVYGIEGLRVADASVMPLIVGGNTNAPTIMIAERAADLLLHSP
jgi:choline dehydrogenase-like flavoprotein